MKNKVTNQNTMKAKDFEYYLITVQDDPYNIYLKEKSSFEWVPISETYGRYGEEISAHEAGDCLEILSEKALNIAIKAISEEELDFALELGEIVSACENDSAYYAIEDAFKNEGINEEEDYRFYKETCLAYTYWDGSNWSSIILAYENSDHTFFEIVDDEELIEKVASQFLAKEFDREEGGYRYYDSEDYLFIVSAWQGSWADYQLEEK